MNNQLALVQQNEWQTLLEMASTLVQSGFLPQAINTPQKAITIILAGRSLGIDEWAALSNINVIQGKPTISAQLMLALINRSGQLEDMTVDGDAKHCTCLMKRFGRGSHVETFTIQDASALGYTNKDNWKKQPAVMLKWRAVAACARVVFPDVILGFYTPEEMGADVRVSDDGGMEILTPERPALQLVNNGDSERRLALPPQDEYEEADTEDDDAHEALLNAIYGETKQHFRDFKHFLNLLDKLFPNGVDGLFAIDVINAINANRAEEGKAGVAWWNDKEGMKALTGALADQEMTLATALQRLGKQMKDFRSAQDLLDALAFQAV